MTTRARSSISMIIQGLFSICLRTSIWCDSLEPSRRDGSEMDLIKGHNICFRSEIRKTISELSLQKEIISQTDKYLACLQKRMFLKTN